MPVKKEAKERSSKKKPEEEKNGRRAAGAESSENLLKIKLVRSLIGRPRVQREVIKGLGLRKVNSEVIRRDCPETWGMVRKISHLVEVEVLEKE